MNNIVVVFPSLLRLKIVCITCWPVRGWLDLVQVARLNMIPNKFRPLNTDTEGARGLQNQNGGSELAMLVPSLGQHFAR